MRKICESILALSPRKPEDPRPSGFPQHIRDPTTGHVYPYDKDEVWDARIPWSDLEFLHHLQHGLTLLDEEKWRQSAEAVGDAVTDRVMRSGEINFYLQIRNAYFLALTDLLDNIRVNGLRQEQLDEAPMRVREERNNIIWDRLVATQLPIKEEELNELDCCICQEPLGKPEPPIKLLCGHIIGQSCLREWIRQWDRESALRVCTLCNKGFDVTALGNEPLENKVLWPGFEPAPLGVDPSAWHVKVLIDRAIEEKGRMDSHPIESPWWMKLLKNNAATI
jgi:hypothetical protein